MLLRSADVSVAAFTMRIMRAYVVAVGVTAQAPVVLCSVCTGVICVTVIKLGIAICMGKVWLQGIESRV